LRYAQNHEFNQIANYHNFEMITEIEFYEKEAYITELRCRE